MLIDVSYFTSGPRHIENASVANIPSQNSIAVNEAIAGYIKCYQREFLAGVLGQNLVESFVDYLAILEQETSEKEKLDKDSNIDPLEESKYELVCKRIREPFADYVFFHILRDMNEQATITGLLRLKCANTYVAPIRRQVSIWNSMVEKNRQFVRWTVSGQCPFRVATNRNLFTPINAFNL